MNIHGILCLQFYFQGHVNTQNYRIWAMENQILHAAVTLHSVKVTVWCGVMVSFIVGRLFFQEMGPVAWGEMGPAHFKARHATAQETFSEMIELSAVKLNLTFKTSNKLTFKVTRLHPCDFWL